MVCIYCKLNFLFQIDNNIQFTRIAEDQSVLQKKGHGHAIHVSDFINDGQLVLQDPSGVIVKDA